ERELHERQEDELLKFKRLLFHTHRFEAASAIRKYVDAVEEKAKSSERIAEDLAEWVLWARKRADWYDPTVPKEEGDLLEGVDVFNLQVRDSYYAFGHVTNYGEKENNFWKPWWLK
ncbi:MAG TPA: hypothetical protein VG737_08795, partial [Cyclobacteriaceae bacterium]|nr:hypothetical protein [Cyclobacteriaceae bacterium]